MPLTRRRFLTIAAGSAALAIAGGSAVARPRDIVRWRGAALGAEAEMLLPGPGAGEAIDAALKEIDRLESILSLYRPTSALCRLNRDGKLAAPPLELVEVLSHAETVSRLSGGAFDVTVQPLWGQAATPERLALVDWRGVEVTPAAVRLARPGMQVTLNGIAQGYVTDRVAEILRRRGHDSVLIDLGEARAVGRHPGGRPWRVAPGTEEAPVALENAALATSADDDDLGQNHLVNPATGGGGVWRSVTVQAVNAMQADALSTALVLLPEAAARRTFAESGAVRAWLRGRDGTVLRLG